MPLEDEIRPKLKLVPLPLDFGEPTFLEKRSPHGVKFKGTSSDAAAKFFISVSTLTEMFNMSDAIEVPDAMQLFEANRIAIFDAAQSLYRLADGMPGDYVIQSADF